MLNVLIVGLQYQLRVRDFRYVDCFLLRVESSVNMVFNAKYELRL